MDDGSWPTLALAGAVLTALTFLLFDALRFFLYRIGPVRLRRLTTDPDLARLNGWFSRHPQHYPLYVQSILQFLLVLSVGLSWLALRSVLEPFSALVWATAGWLVALSVWKIALAAVPDETGDLLLRRALPVTRIFIFAFWPLLAPLRNVLEQFELRRVEEEDGEEVSDEEVRAYIDVGEQEGIFEESEGKLIASIVEFGETIARELMTPRIDVLAFDATGAVKDLARLFSDSKYSRIPIYEKNIDRIVGIVHIKDLFDAFLENPDRKVREIASSAYFISETKRVPELLRELQIEHLQMAIVVDEYGGTAGIITIEDIVEQIVGEIADEHEDEEESIIEVEPDVWLLNGQVRTDTLEERLGIDVQGEGWETVAGLIFTSSGRVPKVGETVRMNGMLFEVLRVDRRRIYQVRMQREAVLTQAGERS